MIRNLYELWQYRALISALVNRHLNARYRGSLLGFIWSFLNPLCLIGVYALVFQYYIRFDDVNNYTLFLFTGLLPWIWFSTGLLEATGAISGGGSLITKAMFPPHVLPIVSVLTNLMNFIFALPLLVGYMLVTGAPLNFSILLLPLIVFIELIFLTGLALALSSLNVFYRDIQHILGNLLTLWFFLCPILYPAKNVPEAFKITLIMNPIALFTEMYQGLFITGTLPNPKHLGLVCAMSLITLILGSAIYNRYREGFAELV